MTITLNGMTFTVSHGMTFNITQDMTSGPPWVRVKIYFANGRTELLSFEPHEFKIFADSMKSVADNFIQKDKSREPTS